MALNRTVGDISSGNSREVSLFDNPGMIKLLPENEKLTVRFDPQVDGQSITEAETTVNEFSFTIIEAGGKLLNSLQEVNGALRDSRLVTGLEEQVTENRQIVE